MNVVNQIKLPSAKKANVWQGKNGRWNYDVEFIRPDGTKYRKNSTAKSQAEAIRKRDDAIAEYNRNLGLAPAEGYTVRTWGQHCMDEVWPQELRAGTLEDYADILRVHIYPAFGHLNLAEVRTPEVQRFFNRLGDKLARQSVQKVKTVFSSLMSRAVSDLIPTNPIRDVKVKKEVYDPDAKPDKRILTDDESVALLAHTTNTYIHGAALLALKMGLRVGECLGLRWVDVDFEKGRLSIRQQVQRARGKGLIVTEPKTRTSIRTMKMPPAVREFLARERERSTSPYVISNGIGKPLQHTRLRQVFTDCAWASGLMTATDDNGEALVAPTFHDLRATFLSNLGRSGADPRQIMELAGHSTPDTTYRHYVRAHAEDLDRLMELVG